MAVFRGKTEMVSNVLIIVTKLIFDILFFIFHYLFLYIYLLGTNVTWSYKQWADKISANFETYFYVNEEPTEGELRPDLIHRRGIIKDTHGATQPWADYQLRPNFPIAMIVVSISNI